MADFPVLSIHQFDATGIEQELYVNRFSDHLHKHHARIAHPHKHDFYLTMLITHGTGFHEIDFERYEVKPGAVFFMQPGQTHYWEFSPDVEGVIFFHSMAYYQWQFPNSQLSDFPFYFSRRNKPFLQLTDLEIPKITDQFNGILQEFYADLSYRYPKIGSLLHCLYIDLSRRYAIEEPQKVIHFQPYAERFKAFEELLNRDYKSEKSATYYASNLHITTKHLNRICKEITGKTSTEIITERVLLEAKRLLSSGSKNLNEIGRELGYEEYAYFSRLFKQYSGESPRAFLQRYH
ncbi:MAG: helix-turn-helix domain-containing protein [Flavobacteriia bacterium]|nr:helix-turn-helix domain-containing protein [Flavobacteriia bacterium]